MTEHTPYSGRIEELHAPKSDAVKAVESVVRSELACRFDLTVWNERYCVTHSTADNYEFRASGLCNAGLAALRLQLDEQARVMGRLREALEEGEKRHRDLDKWTLDRVEADPDSYIWVIREALSTEPKEA